MANLQKHNSGNPKEKNKVMFFFNSIFFYPFQNLKKRFGEILHFSQFLTFIKYLIKYISWELAPAQAGAVYWLISNSPILQHLLILLAAPKLAHFTHLIKPLSGFNRDIYFLQRFTNFTCILNLFVQLNIFPHLSHLKLLLIRLHQKRQNAPN